MKLKLKSYQKRQNKNEGNYLQQLTKRINLLNKKFKDIKQ